ncbi:glycosyltransferase family 87 protein [Corynebacterium tapiri]|uniref:DUF2029 domain-containing protein n=1 Tax=Corynebacterium tapiri TaxID=1448266 RepID=A0A5C4U5N4_9CORY|nr:glycosyltransferase family 87 protein [Corynebacterium tapiri]TNL99790.1 DUF2029 domain-containing protein [Corynebacterium tapiri]
MNLNLHPTEYEAPVVSESHGRRVAYSLMTAAILLVGGFISVAQMRAVDFPVDMAIYRAGVRAFMDGGEMYTVPMMAGDLALPFIYPPFGALVMVPLTAPSWLSDDIAGNIMIGISNLFLLFGLYFVLRAVCKGLPISLIRLLTAATWALVLVFEPIRLNNSFAQINAFLMCLVLIDLAPRNTKWIPRGTLIGIAAAIKLTPLAFGLYLLLRKDFRALITTAISAVVCTLLAALWRLDSTIQFYFSTLLGMGTESQIGVDTTYQSNSSLKGMLMRFSPSAQWLDTHSTLINVLWLVLVLATIGLGALLMVALLRRGLTVDAVLVNAIVMLLISPVSWSHHWVWAAVFIPVWIWRAVTVFPRPTGLIGVLIVWMACVITVPPKWWFGDSINVFALPLWQKILVSDYVWLGMAILIAVALAVRQIPRQSIQATQPGAPSRPVN